MIDGDRCPHCGSADYGPVNEGHEQCCLACGYDTENGATSVCPGGMHPLDWRIKGGAPRRTLCCNACYARLPRDLPEHPRWRSSLRHVCAKVYKFPHEREAEQTLIDAVTAWLNAHPRETSNP